MERSQGLQNATRQPGVVSCSNSPAQVTSRLDFGRSDNRPDNQLMMKEGFLYLEQFCLFSTDVFFSEEGGREGKGIEEEGGSGG